MSLKATCTKNPDHGRFETTAHVMQVWEVDFEGNFVLEIHPCIEVTHEPDPGNIWTCLECGAQAKVERMNGL